MYLDTTVEVCACQYDAHMHAHDLSKIVENLDKTRRELPVLPKPRCVYRFVPAPLLF
jgi:hypothetical protein